MVVRPSGFSCRWSATWLALTAASCVTTIIEEEPPALLHSPTVQIPLQGAGVVEHHAVATYYNSVLVQLQDAVRERNPELIRMLLATHARSSSPDWVLEKFARFAALAYVVELELHLMRASVLEKRSGGALGEPLTFVMQVPPLTQPVTLYGRDEDQPTLFRVSYEMIDTDRFGSRTLRGFQQELDLPDNVGLDGGTVLELPFGIDGLGAEGIVREVVMSVDLLPGHVGVDGEPTPNHLTRCHERIFEVYPRGVEPIRAEPLKTLEAALQSGLPRHLDNLYLAARFMPEQDREEAIQLLIDALRVARPERGRVCMVALRTLTGTELSPDDRDGWLRWWNQRSGR